MEGQRADVLIHLFAALLAGGAIGIERSYHGRPAGFRTHTLVCLASSLLMLITVYQPRWFQVAFGDTAWMDPTRMAQGIVTGIGFLGGGVIFKEGIGVRGLTTAASVWMTAAIGILMGLGLYFPAVTGTVLTMAVLTVFRRIEMRLPSNFYAHHMVRFARENVMPEAELRSLLREHGFRVAHVSYHLVDNGRYFEYQMSIRTVDEKNVTRLAQTLGRNEAVREFVIAPGG